MWLLSRFVNPTIKTTTILKKNGKINLATILSTCPIDSIAMYSNMVIAHGINVLRKTFIKYHLTDNPISLFKIKTRIMTITMLNKRLIIKTELAPKLSFKQIKVTINIAK